MVTTTTLDEQLHEDAGPDLIKIDVEGADLEVLHRPEEQDHPPLAKRGTRPIAPRDQRTASTYIFGAVCPKQGKGAALILPTCNTEAMNLHLAEIAATVAPAAHAILLVDQAGWHMSTRLIVPANITIIPLPPKCPELNPVENVWQFLRDNWLSNHVYKAERDARSSVSSVTDNAHGNLTLLASRP